MADLTPKDDKGEKLGLDTHQYSEGHIFELHAEQLGRSLNLNGQTLSGNATLSGTITFDNAVVLSSGIAAGDLTITGNLSVQQTAALDCVHTITGGEAKDAILALTSDDGDDDPDHWRLRNNHSGNSLLIENYIAASWVTIMTIGSLGGDVEIFPRGNYFRVGNSSEFSIDEDCSILLNGNDGNNTGLHYDSVGSYVGFNLGGSPIWGYDADEVFLESTMKLTFDGQGGNVRMVWNNGDSRLEFYIGGNLAGYVNEATGFVNV